jgi:hypothetical protein
MRDDHEDGPAFVPGAWYMFAAPGGFTLIGRYVRPLGLHAHRFEHATHLRNAGDLSLPTICKQGPGPKTVLVDPFPRYWNGTPIWWADYLGKTPWVKQ